MWLNTQLHNYGISEKMMFINGAHADMAEFRDGTIAGKAIEDDVIPVIGGLYYWNPSKRPYLYISPSNNLTVGKK